MENAYVNQQPMPMAPAAQLATNRCMWKVILLSLITFGIYGIWFFTKLGNDLNTVCTRYDNKKTMNFCLVTFVFSWLTLGIVPLVWMHRISARCGKELARRGIAYKFGAGSFWGWNVFGALIVVGPFVYTHKLCKAMNLMCESYNQIG